MDKKEIYKSKILKASEEIIQNQGLKALTVSNIVNNCNISRRSFYEVFSSKHDLEKALNEILSEEQQIKDKSDEIIAEAYKVFSQYGYQNTDIDTIAKAAGTNRSIIYKYFSSKEDLFSYCLQRELELFKKITEVNLLAPKNALSALDDYFAGFFYYLENHYQHSLLKDVNEQFIKNQKIARDMKESADRLIGLYENFLELGIKQGVFKENIDTKSMAALMHSMTVGINVYHQLNSSTDINGKIKECFIYIIKSALCK